MKNKIILLTGATSGLGKETAKVLAKEGHTVILHGRNKAKTEATVKAIKKDIPSAKLDVLIADLESMKSIKAMVEEFKRKYDHLDVLINNAGNQYGASREVTPEGLERTMAINTFAPFLLTYLLLESLDKSGNGRVVAVSSASHAQGGKPYMDDIELVNHYSYMKAYGVSKLYVIWVMRHFEKYCHENNIRNVTFNCVHPGSVKTNLGNTGNRPLILKILFWGWQIFMIPIEKGIAPIIFAAMSPEMEGKNNLYIGPKGYEKVNEKYYTQENEKIVWDHCMKVTLLHK